MELLTKIKESIEDHILDPINDFKCFIKWRIRHRGFKCYRLPIKTLPPQFCEYDDVLLHGMFATLVDFLENDAEEDWLKFHIENVSTEMDKETGMDECNQRWAKACVEIKELYEWWTITRPSRPDPHDLLPDVDNFLDKLSNPEKSKNDAQMKAFRKACSKVHKIEQQYDREDQQMMIRLVKVRQYLWT